MMPALALMVVLVLLPLVLVLGYTSATSAYIALRTGTLKLPMGFRVRRENGSARFFGYVALNVAVAVFMVAIASLLIAMLAETVRILA